ncbi:hypothetical protein, conserved [Eimeria tenella]|uniref:Uncharacterized protein n=1 Tax=Eimeria tenella TaxID=5802 RepID=U6KJ81_EIMTE|nr:hypothetical protein, conserved [Eimeria tenella]CDJ38095.1 hypothetical protein, conserved [Eimeria tenella]|eukprot:XP_013228933.1 hypothetical protein, conserved [Eimeria tenella]
MVAAPAPAAAAAAAGAAAAAAAAAARAPVEDQKKPTKVTNKGHDPQMKGLLVLEAIPDSPDLGMVYIGRNAEQNERLSFSFSKPSDIWMHAEGMPGAHVLLRLPNKASSMDQSSFQEDSSRGKTRVESPLKEGPAGGPSGGALAFAADCAAYFSKCKTQRQVPVVCTTAGQLTKPWGSPLGTVAIRGKTHRLTGRPSRAAPRISEAILKRREQNEKKKTKNTEGSTGQNHAVAAAKAPAADPATTAPEATNAEAATAAPTVATAASNIVAARDAAASATPNATGAGLVGGATAIAAEQEQTEQQSCSSNSSI